MGRSYICISSPITHHPSPDELKDWEVASFYLVKDNQILYKFPYRFENNSSKGYIGLFDSMGAVDFCDVNDDKKDDVIIITYMSLEQDQQEWFHARV